MSLKARIARLGKLLRPDGFCPECQRVTIRYADEPDPRPAVCPKCGRGPRDYPRRLRSIVIRRPGQCGLEHHQEQ